MGALTKKILFSLTLLFLIITNTKSEDFKSCAVRYLENGTVCVCIAEYCDSTPQVLDLDSNGYQLISTSKSKLGFSEEIGKFSNNTSEDLYLNIPNFDVSKSAKILGFGGAFTDTTGLNVGKLSSELQKVLIDSYYGKKGIEYTLGRVPIGGADFSPRGYTNCDTEDETLNSFALQEEDFNYKIKTVKSARLSQPDLKLFASAWSAPKWMKTNSDYVGNGSLKEEYYQLWAEYYIKWFEAYKQQGVEFWGVTVHNEGYTSDVRINNMRWNYSSMNTWVSNNFGPQIRNSEFKDLKIILLDDNRYLLQGLQENTLNNEAVVQYADGIAVHWYSDSSDNQNQLDYAKSDLKNLFVLATEASNPNYPLGSWDYAMAYYNDILIDLKHNLSGWVDWNMVVDTTGGPSWRQASLGAPILVNADSSNDEFLKQPTYYALGHFSKYVTPGSQRFEITESVEFSANKLTSIGFLRPDNKVVLIISNENEKVITVGVNFLSLGTSETLSFHPHSINTLVYNI